MYNFPKIFLTVKGNSFVVIFFCTTPLGYYEAGGRVWVMGKPRGPIPFTHMSNGISIACLDGSRRLNSKIFSIFEMAVFGALEQNLQ